MTLLSRLRRFRTLEISAGTALAGWLSIKAKPVFFFLAGNAGLAYFAQMPLIFHCAIGVVCGLLALEYRIAKPVRNRYLLAGRMINRHWPKGLRLIGPKQDFRLHLIQDGIAFFLPGAAGVHKNALLAATAGMLYRTPHKTGLYDRQGAEKRALVLDRSEADWEDRLTEWCTAAKGLTSGHEKLDFIRNVQQRGGWAALLGAY